MNNKSSRFCFASDNDAHHYIIPAHRKADWDAWLALTEDDENYQVLPVWAMEVGNIYHVTFADVKESN